MCADSGAKEIVTPNIRVRVLTDVPENGKEDSIKLREAEGASVVAVQQDNGTWTIVATWLK